MFAPQHPTMGVYPFDHRVGEGSYQRFMVRVGQVERGAHMNTPNIGVAIHCVAEAVVIKQSPELFDEVAHYLHRNRTIFDHGHRSSRAPGAANLGPSNQTDGVGANLPGGLLIGFGVEKSDPESAVASQDPSLDRLIPPSIERSIGLVLDQQNRTVMVADHRFKGRPGR